MTATSRQSISSIVVAAAVAIGAGLIGVGAAGAGSSAENRIAVDVAAFISGPGTVTSTGAVTVRATDNSTIKADVGAAALSIGAGLGGVALSIGVALAWNEIANAVEAYIQGATVSGVERHGHRTGHDDDPRLHDRRRRGRRHRGAGRRRAFAGAGALADNTIRSAVRAYASRCRHHLDRCRRATFEATLDLDHHGDGARDRGRRSASASSIGALAIGAAVARNHLGLDYDFTSTGVADSCATATRFSSTDGYGGGGTPGAVYRYIGSRATIASAARTTTTPRAGCSSCRTASRLSCTTRASMPAAR